MRLRSERELDSSLPYLPWLTHPAQPSSPESLTTAILNGCFDQRAKQSHLSDLLIRIQAQGQRSLLRLSALQLSLKELLGRLSGHPTSP